MIKAFGSFRDILGKEIELEIQESSNVEDAINILSKRYSEFQKDFNDETLLVLNGKVVLRRQGAIEPVTMQKGDILSIFPPVSGG